MYTVSEADCRSLEISTRREWLLTNGIGGFASATVSGINTRRYHGLLVAATKPPAGREVLLAAVDAFITVDGQQYGLSSNQYPGAIFPEGFLYLRSFQVEDKAIWKFDVRGNAFERHVWMTHGTNETTIEYINTSKKVVQLNLRPLVCHKPYHENFRERSDYPSKIKFSSDSTVVGHQDVELVLEHRQAIREPVQGWYYRFEHQRETERGLDPKDDLYCPCNLTYILQPGERATLVARSGDALFTEPQNELPSDDTVINKLRRACRHFVVRSPKRSTIIAGYPWFTDWGRDSMIALPGICLHTGRIETARQILRDYGTQTFQGLIPNRFVEDGETPDYNTVDATLWYANAIYLTLQAEWNEEFAQQMLAVLKQIYVWHMKGTLFGIKVDPNDGLLTQGERGVQLTWMDAKVGDWVVTPRYGKPVEINGLWVNMLRILEWLCEKLGEDCKTYSDAAERAEQWFELKFFHEHKGHFVDTIDPLDVSLRPNQLIAMALPFGPAVGHRAKRALEVVERELLTPKGLRTLGPQEANYRSRFEGNMVQLDSAYHQGTAWPWLLGQYARAQIRINGDYDAARHALSHAGEMLTEYGIGGIAEVYDGNAPQRPNGCPWQAWSVGEILRALVDIENGIKAVQREPLPMAATTRQT